MGNWCQFVFNILIFTNMNGYHFFPHLDELLSACRKGTALYGHAPNLASYVIQKAKSLRTAIASLTAALEEKPQQETVTAKKPPLVYRLYSQPLLYQMVRFVGYGGSEIEFGTFTATWPSSIRRKRPVPP
jgi:hypothetical protein